MPVLLRRLLMVFLWVSCVTPCMAQLPTLFSGKSFTPVPAAKATAGQSNAEDPVNDLAEANARLSDAQSTMERIRRSLDLKGQPDSVRDRLLKQFNAQQLLVDQYFQQVNYLKQLQVLDQKIADAKQQRDAWVAPAGEPPWPLVDGDQVRSAMFVQETRIKQLQGESARLSNQIVAQGKEKSEIESRIRRLQELVDGQTQVDVNGPLLEDAKVALAQRSAILLRIDLERQTKDRERELLETELATATKTWRYYDGRFVLSPEVLAGIQERLQKEIDRYRDLELKVLAQSEAAVASLSKAQSAYQRLDQTNAAPARLSAARAALDIAQADEAAARSRVDELRQLIEIDTYDLHLWATRGELYKTPRPDAARLKEMTRQVQQGLLQVAQSGSFLRQALTTKDQEAFDLRATSQQVLDLQDRRVVVAKLAAANAQADASRSVLGALDKFDQQLRLLQSDLGIEGQAQSWTERLQAYGQLLVNVSQGVWRYELFTVEDVVIADGKEVKSLRSVTIGKSIGAIVILALGFMLVSWFIRASLGLAERRLGLKSSAATVTRRWLTLLATATLIVLSLNLVQIPLSVFAFLGGALAIGVGFGTQNLLKNLISGVMLLVERPIRIGDLVEIDGIRGRVTSIGIRFSTILSSDGVDTLIPNSELVERKLTNWTFSNPNVRREIRVGVAYSADPVQVKNLMQAAALEHPEVMQAPEPMVILDELGDSALLFTLRYWVRLDAAIDGRRLDSDLRCEILEKLNVAGIEVPYPQRDVRLSVAEPLPIRLQPAQDAR